MSQPILKIIHNPREIMFISPLWKGNQVIKVFFHTSTVRFICYYELGETREPLTLAVDDIEYYVSLAKREMSLKQPS